MSSGNNSNIISADNPLDDETVILVIDTNILIEFDALPQISWNEVFPAATSITVVVPGTVVKEMDAHKKGQPRVRRRALDFNSTLVAIEDGNGRSAELAAAPVRVVLELMPRYSASDLTHEKLVLDQNDDRIIAEAIRYSKDTPQAIFIADDNNARRTAREMGLRVARPSEQWRRKEPQDDRDATIESLKRQLGALPKIKLASVDQDNLVLFETIRPESFPRGFCKRVAEILLEKNPGHSREELIRRHNPPAAEDRFAALMGSTFRVTLADIDRYCANYKKFEQRAIAWADGLPDAISRMDFAGPVSVIIENEGGAFAEHIELSFSTSAGYAFFPEHVIQAFVNFGHEPPDSPSEFPHTYMGPSFFEMQRDNRVDPFEFYESEAADIDGGTSRIAFVCEKFRHGSARELSVIVCKSKDAPAGGLVALVASSASLADPVRATLPIRTAVKPSEDFKGYLQKRLQFFPDDVHDVISAALREF